MRTSPDNPSKDLRLCGALHNRKSHRGLAAIVEQELDHHPFDGGLYAFTNRQRNKIKLLLWEDNGFVLYYKALAEEKFRWPRPEDEVMPLTGPGHGYPLLASMLWNPAHVDLRKLVGRCRSFL
jgi:transposase